MGRRPPEARSFRRCSATFGDPDAHAATIGVSAHVIVVLRRPCWLGRRRTGSTLVPVTSASRRTFVEREGSSLAYRARRPVEASVVELIQLPLERLLDQLDRRHSEFIAERPAVSDRRPFGTNARELGGKESPRFSGRSFVGVR